MKRESQALSTGGALPRSPLAHPEGGIHYGFMKRPWPPLKSSELEWKRTGVQYLGKAPGTPPGLHLNLGSFENAEKGLAMSASWEINR